MRLNRTLLLSNVVALALCAAAVGQFSLTTTYASNNGQDGNMFDIVASVPVLINSFDGNLDPGSHNISIYMVTGGGSHQGNENVAGAWTLIGTASGVVSNGNDVPTPIPLALNVMILPGQTQGFYFTTDGPTSLNYTNGSNLGGITAMDANIQILEGTGNTFPFGGTFPSTPVAGGESRIWNGTVHYTIVSSFADDLSMVSVDSPVSVTMGCDPLSSTETVSVTLLNIGSNMVPAAPIPISYTVDDGVNPPVTVNEMYTPAAPLMQFDSDTYTFTTPADLSVPGSYTIDATISLPGDGDTSNDTRSETVASGGAVIVNSFPYTEDFDGYGATNGGTVPPPGWAQDMADATGTNSDWIFRNTTTPTTNTGPSADQTTGVAGVGFYAHVEDAGNFTAVNLDTACIDLVTNADPRLSYYIHSNDANGGTTQNFLAVDAIVYPGAVVMPDIAPPIGHLGDMWVQQVVDLTPFNGQTIQIRFRGRSDGGTAHDIAIDTVQIVDVSNQGNGQPPIPGLSVMDINGSREAIGFPVSAGLPGPYFATAQAGGTIEFSFEGEPTQPIVLLFGPLNPGAFLLLPLAGQLDIGSFDPMQGLTQVFLAGAGTGNGFFDLLLNTRADGTAGFTFGVPVNASGFHQAFQALIFASAPVVISPTNAVDLMIN